MKVARKSFQKSAMASCATDVEDIKDSKLRRELEANGFFGHFDIFSSSKLVQC